MLMESDYNMYEAKDIECTDQAIRAAWQESPDYKHLNHYHYNDLSSGHLSSA